MLDPRTRIVATSLAALALSLVLSVVVIGGQQRSGRADLTERATTFVRLLKGEVSPSGARIDVDTTDFLRPEDRGSRAVLEGLERLAESFRQAPDEIDVARVDIQDASHARTSSPGGYVVRRSSRQREVVGSHPIEWIRGGDGRWYLDPKGL